MPQVKGDDEAYEDRLVILEELGIEENALEHDESTDEVSASSDEAAIKRFFARAGMGRRKCRRNSPRNL